MERIVGAAARSKIERFYRVGCRVDVRYVSPFIRAEHVVDGIACEKLRTWPAAHDPVIPFQMQRFEIKQTGWAGGDAEKRRLRIARTGMVPRTHYEIVIRARRL